MPDNTTAPQQTEREADKKSLVLRNRVQLSPFKLAYLACTLGKAEMDDAKSLVKKALEIWDEANAALTISGQEKIQQIDDDGFLSFSDMAKIGVVPRIGDNERTVDTKNGVNDAVVRFLEYLEKQLESAISENKCDKDGRGNWQQAFQTLKSEIHKKTVFPLAPSSIFGASSLNPKKTAFE